MARRGTNTQLANKKVRLSIEKRKVKNATIESMPEIIPAINAFLMAVFEGSIHECFGRQM